MTAQKASIKTEVPGPKSKELGRLREEYLSKGVGIVAPIFIETAEGSLLNDVDGNVFIDMGSGIGVNNVGNRPPEVVAAVKGQADKFLHLCFQVTPYESYIRLAEKLAKIAPGKDLTKSVLFNSGAEAVENSVKISRHFTKKSAAFSFVHAFHGRTMMAMALTSKEMPYKAGFGPLPETYKVDFAYCYRCPLQMSYPSCGIACADKIDEIWSAPQFEGKVACLIGEPISGEGGFIVPPKEFYPKITKICRNHGVVYIDDEIQTGAGRTGRMWCVEHWPGTEPDMLVSGKGIGGGFPVSATTGRPEIMDAPQVGGLGGTFGGNPVACVAALAQMDLIEKALKNVSKINVYMTRRLLELQKRFPIIGDVRGMGAMMAVELVDDAKTKAPAAKETKAVKVAALQRGLLLLTCGTYDNVIRLHPSMVMSPETLEQAMDLLEQSFEEVIKK
ncbi:MAG: aminotransferase class III-fold pyridoxal phosphate-dependent enzyme [Candidatus Thermoplasmatota archaeon]|nr:aminotransferase class III-fold pyridoxal phosphate-dependent enzyme [Candidatus Thermoplasmatota archaeon]